jgi:hypothetical protein
MVKIAAIACLLAGGAGYELREDSPSSLEVFTWLAANAFRGRRSVSRLEHEIWEEQAHGFVKA